MYYYVFPEVGMWGGIKKGFHWVEHLATAAKAAAVTPGGAKPTWFRSNCDIVARETLQIQPEDVVIFSWYGDAQWVLSLPCHRKIFHVQDAFPPTLELIKHPALELITSGLIILGECNRVGRVARYIPYGIPDCFFWNWEPKECGTVVVMGRKNPEFVKTIVNALPPSSRLISIDNMCEEAVAELLKRTDVFVPISTQESIGLPPLEAMCANCVVCGFPGVGGYEFMHHGETSYNAVNGDAEMLKKNLNEILYVHNEDIRNRLRQQASELMKNHTMKLERERLIRAVIPPPKVNRIDRWSPVYKMRVNSTGLDELAALLPINSVVAEIGSYAGESARIFMDSKRVAKFYAIDPWLNGYDNWDFANFSDMRAVESQFDARVAGLNVVKMKMQNLDAAKQITEPLDMVYIDGCHQYAAVKEDIGIWASKVKPGGILAGHDIDIEGVRQAVMEFAAGREVLKFKDASWAIRM
jgi:predicted O-methyltransferase YrrM